MRECGGFDFSREVPVLGVSGGGVAGFAELVVLEEAVEEAGAWVWGADPESLVGQVFSGVGPGFPALSSGAERELGNPPGRYGNPGWHGLFGKGWGN
jgi:hypothetical protein